MVRSGGRYLLFYSGNEHRSAAYAVGYADCASPAGPCTKHGGNPILASSGDRLGPGPPAPFHDTSGNLRPAYHYLNAPYTNYPPYPAPEATDHFPTNGHPPIALHTLTVPTGGVRETR